MTQPVDWPDWLQLPAYTTQFFNTSGIAGPLAIVAEAATGYFQHALVVLIGDGDGSSWTVSLQQWSANPIEGGSLMWENFSTRIYPGAVVIPLTVAGTFLRIVDVDADTYPHNALGYISLFSARGFLNGYPGGVRVLATANTVPGTDVILYDDLSCGPGEHSISLSTTAAAWKLELVSWIDSGNSVTSLLADNTTTPLYAIRFLAPASQWQLLFTNSDVTDSDVSLIVTRQP